MLEELQKKALHETLNMADEDCDASESGISAKTVNEEKICPRCGAKLVLRTTKQGKMQEISSGDAVHFRNAVTYKMYHHKNSIHKHEQ